MKLNDRTAWVHPNPLLSDTVILPDGYQMGREEAKAKGYAVTAWPKDEMAAAVHPHEMDSVILARGTVVNGDTARAAGFTIGERHIRAPDAKSVWRSAIYALPEAQSRPAAVAELLTSRTPETLTAEQARAFLRGLPAESDQTEQLEDIMTTNEDPRAARRAEIALSVNAFNKSRGYASKDLRVDIKDIEPTRLHRLAEIRLSAMEANGRSMTAEFKNLKLALDTHSAMGGDFSRTLAQAGVDARSLAPKAI